MKRFSFVLIFVMALSFCFVDAGACTVPQRCDNDVNYNSNNNYNANLNNNSATAISAPYINANPIAISAPNIDNNFNPTNIVAPIQNNDQIVNNNINPVLNNNPQFNNNPQANANAQGGNANANARAQGGNATAQGGQGGTGGSASVTGSGNSSSSISGSGNSSISGSGNSTMTGSGNSTMTDSGNSAVSGSGNSTISNIGNPTIKIEAPKPIRQHVAAHAPGVNVGDGNYLGEQKADWKVTTKVWDFENVITKQMAEDNDAIGKIRGVSRFAKKQPAISSFEVLVADPAMQGNDIRLACAQKLAKVSADTNGNDKASYDTLFWALAQYNFDEVNAPKMMIINHGYTLANVVDADNLSVGGVLSKVLSFTAAGSVAPGFGTGTVKAGNTTRPFITVLYCK